MAFVSAVARRGMCGRTRASACAVSSRVTSFAAGARRACVQVQRRGADNDDDESSERETDVARLKTMPPRDYPQLYVQSSETIRAALKDGVQFLELEFPALKNMATSALNQIADANREHAKELALALAGAKDREQIGTVCLVFPDDGEAALATRVFGENTSLPFRIGSLASAAAATQSGTQQKEQAAISAPKTLFIVVNPGFNIEEWMQLEALHLGHPEDSILVINGGMDRVRGGYYPRLFYPKLHKTKDRFLYRFEPVFFYKPFGSGLGTLFRKYPMPWQTLFHVRQGGGYRLLSEDTQRPEYKQVESNFRSEALRLYQNDRSSNKK